MKYYLLAGEASGDLHGSYLMKAILAEDAAAEFRFWGGDKMQAVGGELVVHYKERALMGFAEIIGNLGKLLDFIRYCKEDIAAYQPDRLVFIDNSGFNLRIAKWAKPAGFSTHYYISPQVWASRPGRVTTIKACVDEMYVVLPFVADFYATHQYPVHYVGHPLLDVIQDFNAQPEQSLTFQPLYSTTNTEQQQIIALLPGSRKQEISVMLPIMLAAAVKHPDFHYVIAQAPSQELAFYQSIIGRLTPLPPQFSIVNDGTYALLRQSHAALVTSGTATLETALFGVPQIVCYKGGWLSYQIAKRLINTKYISLVNLVLDRPLVPELIQHDLTANQLQQALGKILAGPERDSQLTGFAELNQALGEQGAPARVAKLLQNEKTDSLTKR